MSRRPVQSWNIKMQLGKLLSAKSKLAVGSVQWSVIKFVKTAYCSLLTAHSSQQGVGLLAVIGIVAVVIIGAVVLTTPQIRQIFFPTPKPSQYEASSSAMPQYSEKQLLYLRNKAIIMKNLNLNEEQFNLLVESANKN